MSAAASDKSSCSATCASSSNTLCSGCGKYYCKRHTIKHRDRSSKQMQKVYSYHNQVQQLLLEDGKRFASHPLMKKIDDWEQQAIAKVQQTAAEVREQFRSVFAKHTIAMNETFAQISQQVNAASQKNGCLESEIKLWLEKLAELKKDYRKPKTINIRQDEHPQAFINKISLCHLSVDTFHQPAGDVHWNNLTNTITHGPSTSDATIRGTTELLTGKHQFRFVIQKIGIPKWAFFGILSNETSSQASVHKTPTVYGWAGHHQVWLNGSHHHQYDGFRCGIDSNHTVELTVDCDRQKMRFVNESLSMEHEIDVCAVKCPLPWVLYLGLYGADDQIRLQLA